MYGLALVQTRTITTLDLQQVSGLSRARSISWSPLPFIQTLAAFESQIWSTYFENTHATEKALVWEGRGGWRTVLCKVLYVRSNMHCSNEFSNSNDVPTEESNRMLVHRQRAYWEVMQQGVGWISLLSYCFYCKGLPAIRGFECHSNWRSAEIKELDRKTTFRIFYSKTFYFLL